MVATLKKAEMLERVWAVFADIPPGDIDADQAASDLVFIDMDVNDETIGTLVTTSAAVRKELEGTPLEGRFCPKGAYLTRDEISEDKQALLMARDAVLLHTGRLIAWAIAMLMALQAPPQLLVLALIIVTGRRPVEIISKEHKWRRASQAGYMAINLAKSKIGTPFPFPVFADTALILRAINRIREEWVCKDKRKSSNSLFKKCADLMDVWSGWNTTFGDLRKATQYVLRGVYCAHAYKLTGGGGMGRILFAKRELFRHESADTSLAYCMFESTDTTVEAEGGAGGDGGGDDGSSDDGGDGGDPFADEMPLNGGAEGAEDGANGVPAQEPPQQEAPQQAAAQAPEAAALAGESPATRVKRNRDAAFGRWCRDLLKRHRRDKDGGWEALMDAFFEDAQ